MFHTCVDDTLQHLSIVEKHPHISYLLERYQDLRMCQVQLRIYKMVLWCIPDAAADADLLAALNSLAASIAQLYKFDAETTSFALPETEYNLLFPKYIEKAHKCFAEVTKNRYLQHLKSSLYCEAEPSCFTSNNDTIEFLDSVHAVLNDYIKAMDKTINHNPYNQFQSLVESVILLKDLVYYTYPLTDSIFQFVVNDWANRAACFSLLLWLLRIKIEAKQLIIDLQLKVNPCNPDFVKLCFEVITVPKMKHVARLPFGEFVSRFVDFFLDNLMFVLNDDDFRMVQEGLIFIITFFADPPADTMNHTELLPLVREQIYAVLDQASYIMCFFSETNIDLSRRKTILDPFLTSIDEVRGDIVNLYFLIPPLSCSTFPSINKLGSFECLLAYLINLKDTMNNNRKLVPFLKHQFFTIHQELSPLRLFMQNTWTMQNEHNELKDIWEQIMSLLYQADFAIKSSFFTDNPIWYNLTCLSFLVKMMKDLQHKVMNIQFETQTKGSHISKTEAIQSLMSYTGVPKPPTSTTNVEAVVGFEKEIELLINRLTWGIGKQLDIVPIVGMGGIGKTTLAIKLFHKRAFCSVSQVYRKRNVLSSILNDLSLNDDEIHEMSDDALAQHLRQSLLRSRYLIVLDDIWDINVWDDIKASFPDNCNGSRIIFTTRISNLSESTPCRLTFLSNDESWKLLQHKTFHKDPCPPHLLEVGKMIAKKCKGLPLSIVVIAGLLARTERSLPQWNKVAETLSSFVSSEGFRDIIKLSYKQLSEALKSCFLYLGAFREDCIINAKDLTLLWVAEGFVLKSGDSSLHKIAKKYLNDLADRNLTIVTERSCNGGIKSCRVHDLIRDFCRAEAQEKHYTCYINSHYKSFPMSSVLYQYRISIEAEWRSLFDAKPRGCKVHSLHYLEDYRYFASKPSVEVNSLHSFLSNFKYVQVLNLMGIMIDGDFPMSITTLVHLRHLALRFSNDLYVPPDIINLWNLETFILCLSRYSGVLISPNDIRRPIGSIRVTEFPYKLELPKEFWKMKRLSHVELKGVGITIALDDEIGVISLLPDLISIGLLFTTSGKFGEELLRRLSNVRKFRCTCTAFWDPHLQKNQLPKLEILTKLDSLFMYYVGDTFRPFMFSMPKTIRKLTLGLFNLPWNEFSAIIGKLSCLEVLVLQCNSFSGKRWNAEDEEFPTIKSLTLHDLDIEEWNASIDSFPSLEKLVLILCIQLIAIPHYFSEVVTLKSIGIHGCKKSVVDSAIQIQIDQVDSGNESFKVDDFGNPH